MDVKPIKRGCMNTNDLLKQVELLKDCIDNGTVVDKYWGLCYNVLLSNFPTMDVFPYWELYSGDCTFPVGNGKDDFMRTDNMHDRRTTYGKLRLALAKHCLAWCEKELKDTV